MIKENYHNSRTSDDIVLKLAPVTKLDKRNKTTSKKFDDYVSRRRIVTSLSFFQFMANLRPSESHIPDAELVKLTFSLKVTFFLQKMKKELQSFKDSSHTIVLSKRIIFSKKCWFFPKNVDFFQKMLTSGKLRGSWY